MKLTREQLNEPKYHDAPLWFVYADYAGRPRMLAAKVSLRAGPPLAIWGYSTWKRAGAYRTLGQHFDSWTAGKPWACYTTREEMLAHPNAIAADELPTENWLRKQYGMGTLRRIEPAPQTRAAAVPRTETRAPTGKLTTEGYVRCAKACGLLAEMCTLETYDPSVGAVPEHWKPKYMEFAHALMALGGK